LNLKQVVKQITSKVSVIKILKIDYDDKNY